jgi:hypothetical protein
MKTLQIDPETGDFVVTAGTLVVLDRTDALVQSMRSRLLMKRREWFLDNSKGLPWESIFVKSPDPGLIESEIRAELEDISGVGAVTSVQVIPDNQSRVASIRVSATSDLGELLDFEEVF